MSHKHALTSDVSLLVLAGPSGEHPQTCPFLPGPGCFVETVSRKAGNCAGTEVSFLPSSCSAALLSLGKCREKKLISLNTGLNQETVALLLIISPRSHDI